MQADKKWKGLEGLIVNERGRKVQYEGRRGRYITLGYRYITLRWALYNAAVGVI